MKKVLHCLVDQTEAMPFLQGEGFQLDTHGIEHVVLQLERPVKRAYTKLNPPPVEVLNGNGQRLLPKPKQHRPKTAECRHCHQKMAGQGLWKHEKSCAKRKKGTH